MRLGEVIGQEALRTILLRLLRGSRFPHALAIEGRRGTGRHTMVMATAQALLCDAPVAGDACGRCQQCVQMAAGTHPDCTVIERGPRAYQVEAIRERVVEEAYASPLQARHRVFVLPDIEQMRPAVANVMLKVLEEPSAKTFMLMTKLPGRVVLPTILSRVQVLRCAPLARADVARLLQQQGCDLLEAKRRAALSQGSHHGLADGGIVEACPLEGLFALLHEPPTQTRIDEVLRELPRHAPDPTVSDAAWQRQTCEQWFDVLIAEIRQRLRAGAARRLVDDLERVMRVRGGLRLNQTPRQVLERLAYTG